MELQVNGWSYHTLGDNKHHFVVNANSACKKYLFAGLFNHGKPVSDCCEECELRLKNQEVLFL